MLSLIGGKFILRKSFARFALQPECCNFNQREHSNYNRSCDSNPAYTYKFQLKTIIIVINREGPLLVFLRAGLALIYSGNPGPWYQHLSELNLQIWNLIRLVSNFAMYLQVPPNLNRSISADPRNKTAYNRSMSADPKTKNGTNGLKTNIDLNDPAIQAKIGNRATKVVEKTIGMIRSE